MLKPTIVTFAITTTLAIGAFLIVDARVDMLEEELKKQYQRNVDLSHQIAEMDSINERNFDSLMDDSIDYDYRLTELEDALNFRP